MILLYLRIGPQGPPSVAHWPQCLRATAGIVMHAGCSQGKAGFSPVATTATTPEEIVLRRSKLQFVRVLFRLLGATSMLDTAPSEPSGNAFLIQTRYRRGSPRAGLWFQPLFGEKPVIRWNTIDNIRVGSTGSQAGLQTLTDLKPKNSRN